MRRLPEHTKGTRVARMVPHAGSHRATRPGHTCHLVKPHDGISHEVDYELRQSGIEEPVLKWQLFCGAALDAYRGLPSASCLYKALRRIDRPHGIGSHPLDELGS